MRRRPDLRAGVSEDPETLLSFVPPPDIVQIGVIVLPVLVQLWFYAGGIQKEGMNRDSFSHFHPREILS